MKSLLTIFFFTLALARSNHALPAHDEGRVANYSYGKGGTKDYEAFSFWIKDRQRGDIVYSYGKDSKEVILTYERAVTVDGVHGFEVRFPNGLKLSVLPRGQSLHIVDAKGNYNKVFRWKYEGPVNGIGTFCNECAEDAKEAMEVLNEYFIS